jgi:hypothetical protein
MTSHPKKRSWSKPLWLAVALLAINAVLLAATPGYARSVADSLGYLFGPKMVRAEVVVKDGALLRAFRIDRGKVRANQGGTLTLLERDGTMVAVPVAPNADVRLGNRAVPLSALRRGMTATTVREGDGPATTVQAARQ